MKFNIKIFLVFLFLFTACNSSPDVLKEDEKTGIETEQSTPIYTPPDKILLTDTLKIIEIFNIDGVEAAAGYDKYYNLFLTFDINDDNKRIPFKESSEPETEWLDYPVDETEKSNIDIFSVKDAVTGELYYFFKAYYASAPFDVYELYLFDIKKQTLIDYKSLTNKSDAREINVTLSKKEELYVLTIPEYGIEHNLDSSFINFETLEKLVDNTDNFKMDAVLKIGSIDSFTSDGTLVKTIRPLIDEKNAYSWLHFKNITISYEIRNGVIIPTEYYMTD